MAIELYATAGSVEKDLRNHVVIVVDVLRATSVMVTAVEHGVRFIIPVSEVEEAVDMRASSGTSACSCAASGGQAHPGVSPVQFPAGVHAGDGRRPRDGHDHDKRAPAPSCAQRTRAVLLLGSFLNASAVAHVARENGENIAIVCAGTNGKFSLDDILCSGAIISRLLELDGNQYLDDLARTGADAL